MMLIVNMNSIHGMIPGKKACQIPPGAIPKNVAKIPCNSLQPYAISKQNVKGVQPTAKHSPLKK